MEEKQQKNLFLNWQTILGFVLLVCGISFVLSIFQTPKYKSQTRLLVLQELNQETDAYAAARSGEYVSSILSKVVYSSTFLDRVLNSGFNVSNDFSEEPLKREKEWEKMLQTAVFSNMGILEVTILNKNKDQAEQLAHAVAHVLATRGEEFHGADYINIKVIDPPATSKRPVVPNIPLNIIVGAILGLMAGIGFVYLFPEFQFTFGKNPFKKKDSQKIWDDPNTLGTDVYREMPEHIPISADPMDMETENELHKEEKGFHIEKGDVLENNPYEKTSERY